MMHFQLFNGFHATLDDGQSLRALGRKSECLICLLALSDGMEMTREKAAGIIWSDRGEDQARASLRQELSQVRRILGSETITSNKRSIRLEREQGNSSGHNSLTVQQTIFLKFRTGSATRLPVGSNRKSVVPKAGAYIAKNPPS